MPSFDIISKANAHEVQNAFDQANRELLQRYDFKGTNVSLSRTDAGFSLMAGSQERVEAAYQVLLDKFLKRKLSLKFLDANDSVPAGGQNFSKKVDLKEGIDTVNAKKIVAIIKDDKKLKVTPSIQKELVRVTGKKKDDLQNVMTMLRDKNLDVEISFENFRD